MMGPVVPLDVLAPVLLRLTETDPEIPGLREGLTEYDVSPGLLGFVVMFAAVLVCIPLLRAMVSKLRGVQHRAAAAGAHPPTGEDDLPDAGGVGHPTSEGEAQAAE